MIKSGKMYILEKDSFFNEYFSKTGDDYQIDHLNEALKYVPNFGTALDVGANYGSWTRHMAKKFNNVYSFEPVDKIYQCLVKNVEEMKNVKLYNNAVGEKRKMVAVGKGKRYDNAGCSTVIGDGDIQMISIDDLKLNNLDFLKLDIEGYEYYALMGGIETIKRCKPIIIFEQNIRSMLEHNIPSDKCGNFLVSLGMKLITKCGDDLIYGW